MKVSGLRMLPGMRGQWLVSAHGILGSGSNQHPPLESDVAAVARAHPKACAGSALLPESTHGERSSYGGPAPILACPR